MSEPTAQDWETVLHAWGDASPHLERLLTRGIELEAQVATLEHLKRDYATALGVIADLRAYVDNLKLEVERLQTPLAEAQPYLKDGETVAECIHRNRRDSDALLTLLAKEKQRAETAGRQIAAVREAWNAYENALSVGDRLNAYDRLSLLLDAPPSEPTR